MDSFPLLGSWFPLLGIMDPHSLAKSVDVEVSSRHTKTMIESMMNVPFINLSLSPKVSLTLVL